MEGKASHPATTTANSKHARCTCGFFTLLGTVGSRPQHQYTPKAVGPKNSIRNVLSVNLPGGAAHLENESDAQPASLVNLTLWWLAPATLTRIVPEIPYSLL